MCVAISLSDECGPNIDVSVPVLIETLKLESAKQEALAAFDFLVTNKGQMPATLQLTFPDNVEAWLASEDFFPSDESQSDDRMRLLCRIYGAHWRVDRKACQIIYRDPIRGGGSSDTDTVVKADLLSFGGQSRRADPELLAEPSGGFRTCRLRRWPEDATPAHVEALPFSTFRVGPVPGQASVFARVTVVVRGGAYDRWVTRSDESMFQVLCGKKMLHRIQSMLHTWDAPEQSQALYGDFFERNLSEMRIIKPVRYQMIIVQPEDGDKTSKPVRFSTTSSLINELHIKDSVARDRAIWLNAYSQDFSLALKYEPRRPGDVGAVRRAGFCEHVPWDQTFELAEHLIADADSGIYEVPVAPAEAPRQPR